ncbi:hypothetical protein UT300012_32400 [Paraclostridium bifermentans]
MNKLTQHKVGVVYDEYGEIIKTVVIKENEDINVINKKRKINDIQMKYINNKNEKYDFDKKLGGFIHMAYVKNELLFNDIGIDRANISRLIYLATFLNYNSDENPGLLVKYTRFKEIIPLTKRDIFKMLKLSEYTFRAFIRDVMKLELLHMKDNKIFLNTEYFNKGSLGFNDRDYTRIYINTTRELYENSSVRSHKRLSYIFQLIPKLHPETNMLLHNPTVNTISPENKMNLNDVCKFLQISNDNYSNGKKLLKELLKFTVKVDGFQTYFFKYITVEDGSGKNDYFVVNPQVIWSGSDMDVAKNIIEKPFFD